MFKKIIIIVILVIVAVSVLLSTFFRKRYVLFRLTDKSSLQYYKFFGTGDVVIKNPFRDRTLEKKVSEVLKAIRNRKENNDNKDLRRFFEENTSSSSKDLDITLNRASKNPRKMLENYTVHDIIKKKYQVIFVLYFIPNGRGCMVINSENHKVIKFFVVY